MDARVVVGIDRSDRSIEALKYAAPLAVALGAHLEVVSAWTPPFIGADYPVEDDVFEETAAEIQTAAVNKAFGGTAPVDLVRRVVKGSPARVLVDASKGARMLVVGSRGHGGFAGMMLGSVSMAVAEYARCPVLVVHDEAPEAA